jgi:hypothetical protein
MSGAPAVVTGQHVLSGWWRRAGAQIIDVDTRTIVV